MCYNGIVKERGTDLSFQKPAAVAVGFFHALMAGSFPIHPGTATLWAFCGGAGNGCFAWKQPFFVARGIFLRLAGAGYETKEVLRDGENDGEAAAFL